MRSSLNGMRSVIGHRNLNRAVRALWLEARYDLPNGALINGEQIVISAFTEVATSTTDPILIIDVGAHRGEWTERMFEALADQSAGHVTFALFEPDPDCRAFLSRKHWAGKVAINSSAVSAAEGSRVFHQRGLMSGANSLEPPSECSADTRHLEVKTTTIDRIWRDHGEPMILVKVDCEGHDLAVIQGASAALLAGGVAAIQFEYNHRWIPARRFLRDVFECLDTNTYAIGKITPAGIELASSWHPEMETYREANFLIFDRSRMAKLPVFPFWGA